MTREGAALRCSEVTVTFSRWGQEVVALRDLSLTIEQGEWVFLVGPNGSGKSTLLKLIAGLLRPTSGELTLWGRMQQAIERRELFRSVFLVHQDPRLGCAPDLSIFENLCLADKDQIPKPRKARKTEYAAILSPFGLSERLDQLAASLSGGERQLLALIVAQKLGSSLLLLDEPLASLDPRNSRACLSIVNDLHARGRTIIQVTHDLGLAVSLGSRCLVLKDGMLAGDYRGEERSNEKILNAWAPAA